MGDPFRNYDNWLVAPMERAARESAAYERIVDEAMDRGDLDEDATDAEIEAYVDRYIEDAEEAAAEDYWERKAEAAEDRFADRDVW